MDRSTDSVYSRKRETDQWGMFLHLSTFLGYIVPLAGLIAPVVIWQVKKTDLPGLDQHGRNAVNFIISLFIYSIVSLLLTFVLIGIPMLLALSVVAVVFPIIAAVKASNGEVWRYPMSIPFV